VTPQKYKGQWFFLNQFCPFFGEYAMNSDHIKADACPNSAARTKSGSSSSSLLPRRGSDGAWVLMRGLERNYLADGGEGLARECLDRQTAELIRDFIEELERQTGKVGDGLFLMPVAFMEWPTQDSFRQWVK
jgi:hypothetical protein